MKKWLIPLTVAAFCVSACDDKNSTQATAEKPQVENTQSQKNAEILPLATVVAPWEINSLDPNQSGVIFQRMNLAETLVEADLNGNLIPALATDWRSNEEGTIWRFTLREGVKFHNDQVLTAQAVVNSLNIAKSKPGVLAKAFIKEIRAVDNKVEIELTKAFVPFPPF